MNNEIERKFFVRELPNLDNIKPLYYERYFLSRGIGVEERITKVNDTYKHEKKTELSNLERMIEKKEITKDEFERLIPAASEVIIRDRYDIQANPKISIQIYSGKYKGLIRAEVEFNSVEEANAFQPLPWMGKEMTNLPIARDSKLIDLSLEEFRSLLL